MFLISIKMFPFSIVKFLNTVIPTQTQKERLLRKPDKCKTLLYPIHATYLGFLSSKPYHMLFAYQKTSKQVLVK